MKKIQTFDSSLFICQSYFNNDGAQLYSILQLLYYTFKKTGNTQKVVSWKSKSLSAEKRTTPTSTNNNLFPSIKWYENSNLCLIFKVNYLKQKNATFSPPNIINLFTVCELDTWSKDLNSDFTLKKMLS